MSPAAKELSALWLAAEQRRDSGEKPIRCYSPPYSIPPGDGDQSGRPWLSDEELSRADELAVIWTRELAEDYAGAHDRLVKKIAKRNAEAVCNPK